mmetsp:Transcript_10154/g.25756  ORF Transcript_10154/g.25756 Transcript_10154/m.25756 type:complete len:276 (-) Transcript_10154:119-946(-)
MGRAIGAVVCLRRLEEVRGCPVAHQTSKLVQAVCVYLEWRQLLPEALEGRIEVAFFKSFDVLLLQDQKLSLEQLLAPCFIATLTAISVLDSNLAPVQEIHDHIPVAIQGAVLKVTDRFRLKLYARLTLQALSDIVVSQRVQRLLDYPHVLRLLECGLGKTLAGMGERYPPQGERVGRHTVPTSTAVAGAIRRPVHSTVAPKGLLTHRNLVSATGGPFRFLPFVVDTPSSSQGRPRGGGCALPLLLPPRAAIGTRVPLLSPASFFSLFFNAMRWQW